MKPNELQHDLTLGETPSVEFKRCGNAPGSDTFETICSFANCYGGNIYLGVEDDGSAIGLPKGTGISIKRNIVNVVNNPNVFDPPATIEFEDIDFEGIDLIRIWVPPSPSLHRYKGRMFERIADADIVVKTETQLLSLCVRKQNTYTEQQVFPYVEPSDLRLDLLPRLRVMASNKRSAHPWRTMTDDELLRSTGLRGKNFATGDEGFNLAAVLLLGDESVVRSLCPAYKTDAVLRRTDLDRYDDRVIVKSNLIEAYGELFAFCEKHLPDRFHLEKTASVSPRDIIIREVVSNLLIHREYSSPFPAKLIIEQNELRTENASRAFFLGRITLADFNPVPKNPLIASFFNHLGLAEELGSGTRNLFKYTAAYSGREPILEEGSVFKATIPLEHREPKSHVEASETLNPIELAMDAARKNGHVTVSELEKAGIARRTAQRVLADLTKEGALEAVGGGRARRYVI